MRKIVALIVLFSVGMVFAQEPEETPRELYEAVCSQCHELQGYVWERSFKSWQATVYQMREYNPRGFTPEEADIIVDFLTENAARMEQEWDSEFVAEESEPEAVRLEPEAAPSPYRATLDASAKAGGYIGFAFLLMAVGTGVFRRQLKRPFVWLHRVAAGVVLVTVLLHSIYFLNTLGLPPLLWFVMGVVSTGTLLVTTACGWFRRRLRGWFIRTHVSAALAALLAAILHWAWIYM